MKRTPLRRKKAMRRFVPKAERSKYAARERAPESWWRFVKTIDDCSVEVAMNGFVMLPGGVSLAVPWTYTPCGGVIEADHETANGLSHKGKDRNVAATCLNHHRERTDHSGAFKLFKKYDMRAFNAWAIERTHVLARIAGVEIPDL